MESGGVAAISWDHLTNIGLGLILLGIILTKVFETSVAAVSTSISVELKQKSYLISFHCCTCMLDFAGVVKSILMLFKITIVTNKFEDKRWKRNKIGDKRIYNRRWERATTIRTYWDIRKWIVLNVYT